MKKKNQYGVASGVGDKSQELLGNYFIFSADVCIILHCKIVAYYARDKIIILYRKYSISRKIEILYSIKICIHCGISYKGTLQPLTINYLLQGVLTSKLPNIDNSCYDVYG